MSDEHDEQALQPGQRVGPYVLQTGGDLDWVPRCMATRDGHTVELSFFHLRPTRELAALRFEREGRAMVRVLDQLQHPNIRRVHELGCHGGSGWLALEPLDELDLAVEQPWQLVRARMREVGDALLAVEQAGLRADIGPDDLFVDRAGRVRVDVASACARVFAGHELGIWPYGAPEQIENPVSTARSRQFVFCMIYWRALFGVLPFPGRSVVEVIHAIMHGQRSAPPPSEVPRALVRALERGLAGDPEGRWPSLRALLDAIDRCDRWFGWLRR